MTKKIDRLYDYLADEEDARVCKEISAAACRVVPGNFFTIFLTQLLTRLGDALASAKVVLPWLLTSVGAPAFFSGLLVPIRESGSMLPQLIIGGYVRGFAIRKWFFVLGSVLQGSAVCAIAWAGFHLQGYVAGVVIIGLLILFSLARGLCSVASKDVIGKTIPKTRRGLLSGYIASVSGLVTIAVGASLLLVSRPATDSYAMLLLGAGLFWFIAALTYTRVSEYAGATEGGGNAIQAALANLSLITTDRVFRNFIITRCLMMSSGLAVPYLIILARQASDDNSLVKLGMFIAAGGIAGFVSGVVWGKLADLSSRKVLLLTAALTALITAAASLLALSPQASGFWLVLLLFVALSITHEGVRLGRKTYIVDMASGNRRTDYVAVSNSLVGLLLLVIGLGSAAIAQISMVAVLALFCVSSLLALTLGWRLPEVQDHNS